MADIDAAARRAPSARSAARASVEPIADDSKLDFIDRLRGVAILMVIAVHHALTFHPHTAFTGIAGYGQMGVQLFFVASAFTLCRSFHLRRDEAAPVASFYIRRVARIAPLYYVGLGFYGAVDAAVRISVPTPNPSVYTLANVAANLLFVHGFVPSAFNSVVPGGWSIATEMSFYALFPALFMLCSALYQKAGFAALAAATLVAVALAATIQTRLDAIPRFVMFNTSFTYCNIVNQLSVFLIGMSGYLLIADRRFTPVLWRDGLLFIVLTMVAKLVIRVDHPLTWVVVPPISAVSFLFLMNVARAWPWRSSWLQAIGRVSYSMYIFHFVVIEIVMALYERYGGGIPAGARPIGYGVTFGLIVILSYLIGRISKRLIEDRGIAAGRALIARLAARDLRRRAA